MSPEGWGGAPGEPRTVHYPCVAGPHNFPTPALEATALVTDLSSVRGPGGTGESHVTASA